MKLLFVHDAQKMKEDKEGNFYTDGAYNMETWDRYLSITSNLNVIFRKENTIYDVKYAKEQFNSVNPNIKFVITIDRKASLSQYINFNNNRINKKIIKREVSNCDRLIVRLPCDAGYIALRYAKKFGKPYLIEVVGCPWDSLWNYNLKGKIIALPNYLTMRSLVKDAPYSIYVTSKFLQRRYPTNGKNTNCSNVSLTEFDNNILEARIEKISEMDKNSKIIIGTTAAVNVRYKGQQYIIKALGKLKEQGITNYEYQLVGGGDQSYLKSVAESYDVSEQIKFLGSMPHYKVFKWLDAIDIYVQPSRQEGLPRALIEAMSQGLPAFGGRTAGIPELLEPKFLFSNTRKNINEICHILKSFDNSTMNKQAKRNFEEAKKYDKSIIEARRQKFFGEFISSCKY